MGLLFVLIIWAIVFAILSVGLGLPGLILAHLYKKRTSKEVKLTAWFFAPGVLIFSFAGLFFFENRQQLYVFVRNEKCKIFTLDGRLIGTFDGIRNFKNDYIVVLLDGKFNYFVIESKKITNL